MQILLETLAVLVDRAVAVGQLKIYRLPQMEAQELPGKDTLEAVAIKTLAVAVAALEQQAGMLGFRLVEMAQLELRLPLLALLLLGRVEAEAQ